ncbi:MAG TPA: hypothetical protein VLW85_03725 [Myxococcales bacterium]|nr:hypothetical protein [Myxococcales bacterium]
MRPIWLALALVAACSASTAPFTPIDWQKVQGGGPLGSVIGTGAAGDFDEKANFTVSAFRDGDVIRIFFGGADTTTVPGQTCGGINPARWRIGTAFSNDGLTFTKIRGALTGGSIVDNGPDGSFDSYLTYRPFVLRDAEGVYRMWYNGATQPFNCPNGTLALDRRIGYAESTDGINFTKMNDGPGPGGSVLPLGPVGSIDEQQVGYVWVIRDTSEYKMYYSANDHQNFWRIGLAVSTDGRSWTKVPGKEAGGSILDLGPSGSFDVACAYQPTVYKQSDQLYRMWYRGCQAAGPFGGPSLGTIGYAESNDGRTWVKIPQADPALGVGAAGSFDSGGLTTPSVFLDGATWNMYYAGFDTTGQYRIGLARAPFQ